ncbi:MAG TPA: hypothetical protein VLM16_06410 [Ginsengibacter sp.]|nr:hypothetical protein [Ginsengibacter sp.]
MELNINRFEEEENIRPTLLKVLCILTFIGSSWLILTNIWAFTTAPKTARMVSSLKSKTENNSTTKVDSLNVGNSDTFNTKNTGSQKKNMGNSKGFFFREKMMSSVSKIMTEENIRKNALGAILSALITLTGAILMWQLKRIGFYLYITGTLIALSVPFFLYGINILSIGIAFFSGFFGVIFIALYALNIRSLR